mmetsp:Transcript_9497/g.38807  ORF Transcript_9497/g.38807 Transcript_9497/m.38807 type:complete len:383 (-) Transcript_9497:99-1247(-)
MAVVTVDEGSLAEVRDVVLRVVLVASEVVQRLLHVVRHALQALADLLPLFANGVLRLLHLVGDELLQSVGVVALELVLLDELFHEVVELVELPVIGEADADALHRINDLHLGIDGREALVELRDKEERQGVLVLLQPLDAELGHLLASLVALQHKGERRPLVVCHREVVAVKVRHPVHLEAAHRHQVLRLALHRRNRHLRRRRQLRLHRNDHRHAHHRLLARLLVDSQELRLGAAEEIRRVGRLLEDTGLEIGLEVVKVPVVLEDGVVVLPLGADEVDLLPALPQHLLLLGVRHSPGLLLSSRSALLPLRCLLHRLLGLLRGRLRTPLRDRRGRAGPLLACEPPRLLRRWLCSAASLRSRCLLLGRRERLPLLHRRSHRLAR